MATIKKIEKALAILSQHDWYWMMSDSNNAYFNARGNMRAFVELVVSINDSTIVKALRTLWTVNYEFVHERCSKESFKVREAELMSIINKFYVMAA